MGVILGLSQAANHISCALAATHRELLGRSFEARTGSVSSQRCHFSVDFPPPPLKWVLQVVAFYFLSFLLLPFIAKMV